MYKLLILIRMAVSSTESCFFYPSHEGEEMHLAFFKLFQENISIFSDTLGAGSERQQQKNINCLYHCHHTLRVAAYISSLTYQGY